MSTLLYRVENPDTGSGPWYDATGNFTGIAHTLTGGRCRELPMPYRADIAGGWFCAAEDLAGLALRFTASDLEQLEALGYGLYEITVPEADIRQAGTHVVFRRANATFRRLPASLLHEKAEQ